MPTLKHPHVERFAQALFLAANNGQYARYAAAKEVGYAPSTARVLAARPDVKARVEELKEAAAKGVVNTVHDRLELLTKIARHEIEIPVSAGHVISAIAEQNKMEGSYAPVKSQIDITEKVMNIVFVLPSGTKVTPKELAEGQVKGGSE